MQPARGTTPFWYLIATLLDWCCTSRERGAVLFCVGIYRAARDCGVFAATLWHRAGMPTIASCKEESPSVSPASERFTVRPQFVIASRQFVRLSESMPTF
jgi:hypothetical protein